MCVRETGLGELSGGDEESAGEEIFPPPNACVLAYEMALQGQVKYEGCQRCRQKPLFCGRLCDGELQWV